MQQIYLTIVLAPLIAAILAGLFGRQVGRVGSHTLTIGGVALSCALSLWVLKIHALDGRPHSTRHSIPGPLSTGSDSRLAFWSTISRR